MTIVRGAGLTNEGASCCSPKLEAGHLIRIITPTQSRHRGYLSWTVLPIVRNIDQDGDWGGAPSASLDLLLFLGYYFDLQASNHGRVGTLIRNILQYGRPSTHFYSFLAVVEGTLFLSNYLDSQVMFPSLPPMLLYFMVKII